MAVSVIALMVPLHASHWLLFLTRNKIEGWCITVWKKDQWAIKEINTWCYHADENILMLRNFYITGSNRLTPYHILRCLNKVNCKSLHLVLCTLNQGCQHNIMMWQSQVVFSYGTWENLHTVPIVGATQPRSAFFARNQIPKLDTFYQ